MKEPSILESKCRFGDLEIFTMIVADYNGAVLAINDGVTSFLCIKKLEGKNGRQLEGKLSQALLPWKEILFTITVNNGKEFAEQKK